MSSIPIAPPKRLRLVKDADADQAERERRHREIMAAKTQRDEPEPETDRPSRATTPIAAAQRPRQPRRQIPGRRQRGDAYAPMPKKPAWPSEIWLTLPEQQREPDRGDREDRHVRSGLREGRIAAPRRRRTRRRSAARTGSVRASARSRAINRAPRGASRRALAAAARGREQKRVHDRVGEAVRDARASLG